MAWQQNIVQGIFIYIIIVFSAVFHEYAHAWMAHRLGDDTAKEQGRLTLNPLPHLDPLGTVAIPLLLLISGAGFIGWARPVPYNPFRLRDHKYGNLKVALAGPASNIIIAVLLGLGLRLIGPALPVSTILAQSALLLVVYVNVVLALFNLIPLPPLDGSKVVMDLFPGVWVSIAQLGIVGVLIAIIIAPYLITPLASSVFHLITGVPIGV